MKKVVLFCMASVGPDDPSYGLGGTAHKAIEFRSGQRIEFIPHGRFTSRERLNADALDADVVMLDVYYPVADSKGIGQKDIQNLSEIIQTIRRDTRKMPRPLVLVQTLEGDMMEPNLIADAVFETFQEAAHTVGLLFNSSNMGGLAFSRTKKHGIPSLG